jgi:hypothetical protein
MMVFGDAKKAAEYLMKRRLPFRPRGVDARGAIEQDRNCFPRLRLMRMRPCQAHAPAFRRDCVVRARIRARLPALAAVPHSGTSRVPPIFTNKATHHYFPQSITWRNASMLH